MTCIRLYRLAGPLAAALLFLAAGPARAEGVFKPKIQVRGAAGIVTNNGTLGGSAFSFGGLNANIALYILSDLAFYAGYAVQFDLKAGSLPVQGVYGGFRYHFLGEGVRVRRDESTISSSTRSRWSLYAGLELAQRGYFYQGTDDFTGAPANIQGSSIAFNTLAGAELRMSDHFDFVVELNNSLLTFAASDQRYRIGGFLVHFGVGILF